MRVVGAVNFSNAISESMTPADQEKIAVAQNLTITEVFTTAVNYMHTNGFAHRDLKPENCTADSISHTSLFYDQTLVLTNFRLSCALNNQQIWSSCERFTTPL